jgi:serine/threonine protein kinase
VKAQCTSGGQATVVIAEDASGERVAIKIYTSHIFATGSEVLDWLRSQIGAEHVARLIDHGGSGRVAYEILEHFPLGTLADLIAREGPRLEAVRVREILQQLAAALDYVHRHVEHRDLKPTNVLVRSERPLDLVLTDFGLAAKVRPGLQGSIYLGGTTKYEPPEARAQVRIEDGSGKVQQQILLHATKWDYWSLGMLLVECLTGRHPFSDLSNASIVHRLVTSDLDELADGVADPTWKRLCTGLLLRDPAERWGQAEVARWLVDPGELTMVMRE